MRYGKESYIGNMRYGHIGNTRYDKDSLYGNMRYGKDS